MSRKIVFFIVTLLLVLQTVQGQSFTVVTPSNHTVYFNLVNGGAEATFCTYSMPNYGTSLSGTLIIPDSVEQGGVKYPVVAIGYNAFHHAYGLDTVILPGTLTNIQQEAFSGCVNLASVAIPNSVTTIGNLAFGACHNLSDLTLGESLVTIGNQAFDCDTALISIVIPNSVTTVGNSAFSQNYNLRTVVFGSSVASVGSFAFAYGYKLDSLVFVSEQAPSFGNKTFSSTPDTLNVIIPCGSYHAYSYWLGTKHNYTVPTVDLTMVVTSSQPQWGSAVVLPDLDSNEVRCDSSVVIKAIPEYGYHFLQWSNGSTRIQDTLMLSGDSAVSAMFTKNQYSLVVQSSDPALGTVSGAGTYNYLDTAVVAASATAPHYFFERWNDGNTDSVRSVVITGNKLLIAYFAVDTHTVAVQPDNIAHGSVSGGGRFVYGTVATVTAAPYSGYQFSHWSDGATYNPYIFAVVGNTSLTAYFIADGEPYQDTIILYDTLHIPVHDTTYVPVHDTTYVPVHDTTYLSTHDTIYLPQYINDTIYVPQYIYDTTYVLVYDTTYVPVHDTTYLSTHDTIYLPQYIHDTIYVHDTIVVGLNEVETIDAKIYIDEGQIVVEGAERNEVCLYDINGRLLATRRDESATLRFGVPVSGAYLVKIGNRPARKIVVIR